MVDLATRYLEIVMYQHGSATPLRTAMNQGFMICDFSLVRNLVHNTIFTSAGSHQNWQQTGQPIR